MKFFSLQIVTRSGLVCLRWRSWASTATFSRRQSGRAAKPRRCQGECASACAVGWVNFSEFEITVCGSCKMSKKINWPFLFFIKFYCFAKILNHFSTPLHSKKMNYIFANIWKLFLTNLRVGNSKMNILSQLSLGMVNFSSILHILFSPVWIQIQKVPEYGSNLDPELDPQHWTVYCTLGCINFDFFLRFKIHSYPRFPMT